MYNFFNNKTLSAMLIASVALTTVACAEDTAPVEETTSETSSTSSPSTKPGPTDTAAPKKNSEPRAHMKSTPKHPANESDSPVNTHLSANSSSAGSASDPVNPLTSFPLNHDSTLFPSTSGTLPLIAGTGNADPNSSDSRDSSYTAKFDVSSRGSSPSADQHVESDNVESDLSDIVDALIDATENDEDFYTPVPKVSTEKDAKDVLSEWEVTKEEAEQSANEATEKLNEATQCLKEKEQVYQDAVKRRDAAKVAFKVAQKRHDDLAKASESQANTRVAEMQSELVRAKKELSHAKQHEASAQSALVKAQQDIVQVRKDKTRVQSKLDAIDAGIASLDRRIEANEARKAELENSTVSDVRDDFSADEYQMLVSQAVIEMINEYRVENGASPLRTHDVYNHSAQSWSDQMAKDGEGEPAYSFGDAFRHSPGTWGASSENIAGNFTAGKQDMTRADWAALPGELFTQWRDSVGHNENMLRSTSQGVGVGVTVDDAGRVWATTQFFVEDTEFASGARMDMDKATSHALNSGEDFYVAQGAKDVLGVQWQAPKGTKGAEVNYQHLQGGRKSQDALVEGLERGVDSRVQVNTVPVSGADRDRVDAEVADIDEAVVGFASQRHDAVSQRSVVEGELEQVQRAEALAEKRVDEAETDVAESQKAVKEAERAVVQASAVPVEVDASVPGEAVVARDEAKVAWDVAEQEVVVAQQGVDEAQSVVSEALVQKSQADEVLQEVLDKEPVVESGVDDEVDAEDDVVSFDDRFDFPQASSVRERG